MERTRQAPLNLDGHGRPRQRHAMATAATSATAAHAPARYGQPAAQSTTTATVRTAPARFSSSTHALPLRANVFSSASSARLRAHVRAAVRFRKTLASEAPQVRGKPASFSEWPKPLSAIPMGWCVKSFFPLLASRHSIGRAPRRQGLKGGGLWSSVQAHLAMPSFMSPCRVAPVVDRLSARPSLSRSLRNTFSSVCKFGLRPSRSA